MLNLATSGRKGEHCSTRQDEEENIARPAHPIRGEEFDNIGHFNVKKRAGKNNFFHVKFCYAEKSLYSNRLRDILTLRDQLVQKTIDWDPSLNQSLKNLKGGCQGRFKSLCGN